MSTVLLLIFNSDRFQNFSSELRQPVKKVIGMETMDLTLGAWLISLVKGLRVSRSWESRMIWSPAGYGNMFPFGRDTMHLDTYYYVENLFDGS